MSNLHFHLSDIFLSHPGNSTLLMATVWTINHLYVGYTNALTFSLWSRTADDETFHRHLLGDILTSIRDSQLTYVTEKGENIQCKGQHHLVESGSTTNNKCLVHKDVIVMIDSFESFMRFRKELAKEYYLIRGFYTIIYTGDKQTYYDVIYRMFEEVFRAFMVNVNVYIEVLGETLVYTFFPFTNFHCRGTSPVLLNRFTAQHGFIYNKSFFPNKVDNLFGCPLTVVTWHGPPYIYVHRMSNGDIKVTGIEGAMLKILATKMNFRIKFIETNRRGRIFPNLTAVDGAVKFILEGSANITINSYVFSEFALKSMLPSYSYASYEIVVAIPQGEFLSSFQRLRKPFKYIIWSCLSSSVLAGIVIIFIIQFLRRKVLRDFVFGPLNSIPLTNLLNVLFGGPVTVLPRRNFARYILLIWLLYTMVLRNAYSGELFIMLQDASATTSLQSVEEMVEKNFTFWCADNTIEIIKKSTETEQIRVIRGPPFQYLSKLHDSDAKIGVVIFRPFVRIYNYYVHRAAPIQTLPTKLISAPLTMYFRRNSYLAEPVNRHLLAFVASGLMRAWDNYYMGRHTEDKSIREPSVLSVQLLLGIFSAYLFFLGFAFIVFLMELWSKHSPICKSVVDFFNL